MKFSNPEAIGSYVYTLSDPESNKLFYIGKGVGQRAFQHAEAAADLQTNPSFYNADTVAMNNVFNRACV